MAGFLSIKGTPVENFTHNDFFAKVGCDASDLSLISVNLPLLPSLSFDATIDLGGTHDLKVPCIACSLQLSLL